MVREVFDYIFKHREFSANLYHSERNNRKRGNFYPIQPDSIFKAMTK